MPTPTVGVPSFDVEIRMVDLKLRHVRVVRIEELSSRMRRIHVAGEDLDPGFCFEPFAPADHCKVFFPDPETGVLTVPHHVGPGWNRQDGPPLLFRDYTLRSFDRATGELAIDFVLHDHGVAGDWATNAQVGDRIALLGPRGTKRFPTGYRHYIAAGDETAFPAMARLVEDLPDGATATVVLHTVNPHDTVEFPVREGVEIHWVSGPEAGPEMSDAVRALPLPDHDDWYAFVAGESSVVAGIRRYFRRELDIPKARVNVDGYWKRGVINLDHHAPDEDD